MNRNPVTVVKVGGSLLDWPGLCERLTTFIGRRTAEEPGFRPVFLCGGGAFVDTVRRMDRIHHLGDFPSHRLAIQAMDLASTVLFCILPGSVGITNLGELDEEREPGDMPMLIPSVMLEELGAIQPNPLPPSWDVTSDTIAAWIAGGLKARSLILLKSAPLPPGAMREDAVRLKLVDPFFPLISTGVAQVEYLNLRDPAAKPVLLP